MLLEMGITTYLSICKLTVHVTCIKSQKHAKATRTDWQEKICGNSEFYEIFIICHSHISVNFPKRLEVVQDLATVQE
jgi:hypothetical protein